MNEYNQSEKQDMNATEETAEATVGAEAAEMQIEGPENGEADSRETESKATTTKGTESEKKSRGFGIAAMILGILSILLICVQPFGVVLAVAAVVLGILGVVKTQGKGMATSGIVMGGISLVTGVVILIFFGSIFQNAFGSADKLTGTAWRKGADGSVLYLYKDGTFIHVDRENDFTDNFYSGTYMVCDYKDSGVRSQEIENTYDTNSVYELKLYVTMYVEDGKEQEHISGTMQYMYAFQKKYHKGDVVQVCAHDKEMFGSFYPVVETELKKPVIGNQYVPELTEDTSETELSTTETGTTELTSTETSTTGGTTETPETEASTTEVPTTEAVPTEAASTETPTTGATTETPKTEAPTTEVVPTETTTERPTTEAVTTEVSTTELPTTEGTTEEPTTEATETTEAPATGDTATEGTTETTEETSTEDSTTEEASTEEDDSKEAAKQWLKDLFEFIRRWFEDLWNQLGL